MRYITLDGPFTTIFSYHFTILNHFRHDRKIYLSFYFLSSLENGLSNHANNNDNHVLHEALNLLIMKYAKMNEVKPSPVHKIEGNPKPSSRPNVYVVLDTKIEDDKGLPKMAMDWSDLHVKDNFLRR